CREQVSAAIQAKRIAAFRRALLEKVDAARHEPKHRVVGPGPPVAVALRALVACEGERIALVDQHHAARALTHGQMVRRGDAANTGSADDDVGALRHQALAARGVIRITRTLASRPYGRDAHAWSNRSTGPCRRESRGRAPRTSRRRARHRRTPRRYG